MPPWEKYQSESAPADGPWSKYGGSTAVAEPEAAPEQPASLADKMVGGWGGRMLMGMASPALAATQMVGGDKGRELVAALEAMKQRGMKAEGNDGFDAYGLAGSLVPGAGIAKGVAAVLPAAKTLGTRLLQGGAVGAATSAAQPVADSQDFWTDKAKQVGLGTAVGGAVPAVGEVAKAVRGAPQLNPTMSKTLQEGLAAGYVVPPSKVNPSFINNRMESIAGKAAVEQEASKRNQEVTNALASQSLGLPKNTTLTPELLNDFRAQQGKVYEDVASLSDKAKTALNEVKQARHDSKVQWNYYNRSGNPEALSTAKNADAMAEMFTDELKNEASKAGREDLIKALSDARVRIAKSYDVSRALNPSSSEVSAPVLGKLFAKRGEKAMTGELGDIGKMAGAFKDSMKVGGNVPSPGVSGTDAAASALLGVTGAIGGGPMGILAGGLPLARGPIRNIVLSKAYQNFATSDPAKYRELVDALAQRGAGAAGTTAGRANP